MHPDPPRVQQKRDMFSLVAKYETSCNFRETKLQKQFILAYNIILKHLPLAYELGWICGES